MEKPTSDEAGSPDFETREEGLRQARALVRKYIPEGVRLSDELVEERRLEAEREWDLAAPARPKPHQADNPT